MLLPLFLFLASRLLVIGMLGQLFRNAVVLFVIQGKIPFIALTLGLNEEALINDLPEKFLRMRPGLRASP